MAKIYCNNCGRGNPEGTVFCKNCSVKISENARANVDSSGDAVASGFIIYLAGGVMIGFGVILSLLGPLIIIGVPLILGGLIVTVVGFGGTGVGIINWIFKSGKRKTKKEE